MIYNWSFGEGFYSDSAISTFTFTEPGIHEVSLYVIDDYGAQSLTKTITVRVQNPLPIISVRILDGWVDGQHMDRNSPRPEGFIPDSWTTLLMTKKIPLQHLDMYYILILRH